MLKLKEGEEKRKMDKHNIKLQLIDNAIIDEGDGLVTFSRPLTITDDTVQWNGTRYDIKSMDIDKFNNKLTVNHGDNIQDIVAKTIGLRKIANKRVVVDGFQFALKENAMAQFAHDMLMGGYLTDFSIETTGPWPDEDGVYKESSLLGLSAVINGNNKSAKLNDIVLNSIEKAKENGLDTAELETNLKEPLDKEKNNPHNNTRDMKAEEIKKEEKVENETPATPVVETPKETPVETPKEDNSEVLNAIKTLTEKVNKIEENAFDKSAKEPEFKEAKDIKTQSTKLNSLRDMDYKVRHGAQILAAWNALKKNSAEDQIKLNDINKIHLELLQEKDIVPNSMTLGDFGNFVISPELLKDIEGFRSNYQGLLSRLDWRETLSLEMAWLSRSGDIDMEEVEPCDDDEDGNLKPVKEYEATPQTSRLHELAAVTPVCNAATRFLAVDLLGDVASGYRNDYDRKRAQLAIARFQQAINSTGNSSVYDMSADLNGLKSFIRAIRPVAEQVMNGVFVFNNSTYLQLVENLVGAGISGSLAGIFTTGNSGDIVGRPYIIVPDDLMPTLGDNDTRSHVVEGTSVTVDQAVFYLDLSTFTGRTSGGLQYDLSTEAAYEVGDEVRSAYQRNELVLRGSFFRGGAVKDPNKVAGLSDFAQS